MPIALRTNLIFSGAFTVFAAVAPEVLMRIFTSDPALIESGAVLSARGVPVISAVRYFTDLPDFAEKYRLCHGQFTDQLYSGRCEYYLQCDLDLRAVGASCVRNTGGGLRDGCRPSGWSSSGVTWRRSSPGVCRSSGRKCSVRRMPF